MILYGESTIILPIATDSSFVFSWELLKADLSLGSSREAPRWAPYSGIVLRVERIMDLYAEILSLKLNFTT